MKQPTVCTSFAPGRALPLNECERCGWMRHEHDPAHRSTPTGHQGVPPPPPADVQIVPRVEVRPDVLYCRACSAGLIIHPPTDPDTYSCPQCGHAGPKAKSPTAQMPDEKAQQRAATSLAATTRANVEYSEQPEREPCGPDLNYFAQPLDSEEITTGVIQAVIANNTIAESDTIPAAALPPEKGENDNADGQEWCVQAEPPVSETGGSSSAGTAEPTAEVS